MTQKRDFETLYAKAISEWPEDITLNITSYDPLNSKYSVNGLSDISDPIIDPWIGHYDEVLMRGLHDAIFIVLHALAANCTYIKLSNLRKESVKNVFEKRLDPPKGGDWYGWTADDHKLVEAYYEQTGGKPAKKTP